MMTVMRWPYTCWYDEGVLRHLLLRRGRRVRRREPPNLKTVYVLPMSGGLDQFVVARLTRDGVMRVVTDPKGAEAVLVDRVGEGFEQRMLELYKGQDVREKDAREKDAREKDEKKDEKKENRPPVTSFGRGRGTVFLVDVRSREVIWSAYEKPRNATPDELHRTAGRIVGQLKKDFTPK